MAARRPGPATRLTQDHRRAAKSGATTASLKLPPRPPTVCRICGTRIKFDRSYCPSCKLRVALECVIEAEKLGHIKGHSHEARALQVEKQRKHAAAVKAWNPSDNPDWLTEDFYLEKIQARLRGVAVPAISSGLGVSEPYAAEIRAGRYIPHLKHWTSLTMYAHHTEYTMPASGMLFANNHDAGRTFIFNVRDHPVVETWFTELAGYMHPHSFLRLPNRRVLATFQHAHHHGDPEGHIGTSGGLVEIDDQGKVVRASGSASPSQTKTAQRRASISV